MTNYKTLLTEQKEALQKDIYQLVESIKAEEEIIESLKDRKSLAQKELRSIEKKLAKIE